MNNGLTYEGFALNRSEYTLTPSNGAVVEFLLNTTINSFGYDISSIVSLTGSGQNRSGQKYDLSYSLIGNAGFITLTGDSGATVNRNAGANNEVQVTIASGTAQPIINHVDALRFTFYNNPNESMYREIDVFGNASVPEPSAFWLLGSAMAGLSLFRRRSE